MLIYICSVIEPCTILNAVYIVIQYLVNSSKNYLLAMSTSFTAFIYLAKCILLI